MGEYARIHANIHKEEMRKLLWRQKRWELESEYLKWQRLYATRTWNGDYTPEQYEFADETFDIMDKEAIVKHYDEKIDYIGEVLYDINISIEEMEGYIKELESIDGEDN